jgi:hypothetical protein
MDLLKRMPDVRLLVQVKLQTPQTLQRSWDIIDQLKAAEDRYQKFIRTRWSQISLPSSRGCRRRLKPPSSTTRGWIFGTGAIFAGKHGCLVFPFLICRSSEDEEQAEVREAAQGLVRRLSTIRPGRADWSNYERLRSNFELLALSAAETGDLAEQRRESSQPARLHSAKLCAGRFPGDSCGIGAAHTCCCRG